MKGSLALILITLLLHSGFFVQEVSIIPPPPVVMTGSKFTIEMRNPGNTSIMVFVAYPFKYIVVEGREKAEYPYISKVLAPGQKWKIVFLAPRFLPRNATHKTFFIIVASLDLETGDMTFNRMDVTVVSPTAMSVEYQELLTRIYELEREIMELKEARYGREIIITGLIAVIIALVAWIVMMRLRRRMPTVKPPFEGI